jgi:hypothetical protein
VRGPCQQKNDVLRCPIRQLILDNTTTMCDSGIFTREGATLSYDKLFETYVRMGVKYGIIIDVFLDPKATLASAEQALKAYEPFRERFHLVGVAQGVEVEDYFQCYARLRDLGFEYIAVGGLLRRRYGTVRYVNVRSDDFMFRVLKGLRQRYPDDWLFALGSFHPNRLSALKDLSVWADYKGWIFQYKKRNETLNSCIKAFSSNHLEHLGDQRVANLVVSLQQTIALRDNAVAEHQKLSRELVEGRRHLRVHLNTVHQELESKGPELATRFANLTTHGLLDDTEERLVEEALERLDKSPAQASTVLDTVRGNRTLKRSIEVSEDQIDKMNSLLGQQIANLEASSVRPPKKTYHLACQIANLIAKTEREHRFEQVREKIAEEILAYL